MKVWTFRLYPESKSSLYALVVVFDRRKDMLEFWRRCKCKGRGYARTQEVIRWDRKRGKPWRRDPKFACLSFWRGGFDAEAIVHELFHATVFFGIRRGFEFKELGVNEKHYEQGNLSRDGVHERLAYAHGRMYRHLVNAANRHKLRMTVFDNDDE